MANKKGGSKSLLRWCRPVVILAVSAVTASCISASRVTRSPEIRQPMMVNLSPESIRLLSSQGGYAQARDPQTGMWLECRMTDPTHNFAPNQSRAGIYRAIAGFVAGAVITPALAAVSPRVGAAWVDVINEFQSRERQPSNASSLLCRQVR
jgi:hypothetical protein